MTESVEKPTKTSIITDMYMDTRLYYVFKTQAKPILSTDWWYADVRMRQCVHPRLVLVFSWDLLHVIPIFLSPYSLLASVLSSVHSGTKN